MKLPLYKDDGIPLVSVSNQQKAEIAAFEQKVIKGVYRYIDNLCICGNKSTDLDIVLAEKDRYGISVKFLLCRKCSIVRTNKKLDEKSLADFYTQYYRKIYGDGLLSIEAEYKHQAKTGAFYKDLLNKHIALERISSVFDYGCGTGGVLESFKSLNKPLYGADYDCDRLHFGQKKGLTLFHMLDDHHLIHNTKYDLVILSHLMEHLAEPITQLNDIFELIADDGYAFIVVPSPLNVGNSPQFTVRFFQNVHLYNFHKLYLTVFFAKLGMKVVYLDEVCQCILQKPKDWIRRDINNIDDDLLVCQYRKILKHFRKITILNDIFKLNLIRFFIRSSVIHCLELLRIKNTLKTLLGR